MAKTLEEVKETVSRKYVGKMGIHAVGIRRSQNAVCVYLHDADAVGQDALLKAIAKEAGPYQVLTVREDRPVAA